MSALEVIGLVFCLYLLWSIVSALFNLLYTCYLGNALGRSINVKKLGSWAGEFVALNFLPLISQLCLWVTTVHFLIQLFPCANQKESFVRYESPVNESCSVIYFRKQTGKIQVTAKILFSPTCLPTFVTHISLRQILFLVEKRSSACYLKRFF